MKVLVADDNKVTRLLLNKLIASFGYQVILASNGEEAWDVLNGADPPQIAILDWLMPGRTGVEICADCEENGLPVYRILLTAKEDDEDMMYALDHGAHDFQVKPIMSGILRSRLSVGKRLIQATQESIRSERLAAVGLLVAGVAHHFNNLNTPILMYASSILKNADLSQRVRDRVKKIEKAARQAGDLTEMLMALASDRKYKKKPVDLNQLVQDVIDIESITMREHEITVDLDLGSIPEACIAENDIRHVVMNLLKNAQHAMIAGPERKITVRTWHQDDMVHLSIADTGCGIAADALQKLFSPFYTKKGEFSEPDSPMSQVKGTGIGLYAAKKIAEDHGGDITVASELGRGSTFTMSLSGSGK